MKYFYNLFAQFTWGMLPLLVTLWLSEQDYIVFENFFSLVVLSSAFVNAIMINLVIVRLYKTGRYVLTSIELAIYLVALFCLTVLSENKLLIFTSIFLLIKGLGYGYLEYITETKRLWFIECGTALCAIALIIVVGPMISNMYILLLLIFGTNIVYLPSNKKCYCH